MRKSSLYCIGIILAVVTGLHSCKKVNGIDNNQILETPYSLFFSDTAGAVYSSNDGKNHTAIFTADGTPCRAICNSGSNILLVKNNVYVSTNNGANFSQSYLNAQSFTAIDCNNQVVKLNQSMILNIPSWSRVYVASNSPSPFNYLGLAFSFTGGLFKSWENFDSYDTTGSIGVGALPVSTVSFTRLTSGAVAALAIEDPYVPGGTIYYRNFYKTDTPGRDQWKETTGGSKGAPRDMSGTPLPQSGFFSLGHINNRLIAIDGTCINGAYFSDDTGRTWTQYTGIPTTISLLSICSPFEETCLIGSSNGLYVLNNNTGSFALNNNGLTAGIRVNGITYKENVFKNGVIQKFVYLATNHGIYQSQDGGNNWVMTIPGNFTTIY